MNKIIKNEEIKTDDILYLHNKIIKYFSNEKNKIDNYIQIIKNLSIELILTEIPHGIKNNEQFLNKLKLNYLKNEDLDDYYPKKLSYKEYKDKINLINNIIAFIENLDFNESVYFTNVENIIYEYNELIKLPQNTSFIGKKDSISNTDLIKVIDKYNLLVKEMFDNKIIFNNVDIPSEYKESKNEKDILSVKNIINTVSTNSKKRENKKSSMCECIKKEENKIEQKNEGSTQIICGECGTIYNNTCNDNITYYDYTRVGVNQKYHYEKRCHFRDTINQYQGKQNKYIPPAVYSTLEEMLISHGLVNVIENEKLKRYSKVTKDHITLFLKESDNSKYYEDIQLIYSNITGKAKPDISKYEKQLYDDFDKLVQVFLTTDNKRKNFLNSHYVLRQLLLRQGIKVHDKELNKLKTRQRLQRHDDIYEKCCEKLNWNFTPMC